MSGRRRQGKSFLLRRLAAGANGLYHQALEVSRQQALQRFGDDVARHLRLPAGALGFADWDIALRTALRLPERGSLAPVPDQSAMPRMLVLDELPYLLVHSPEIPSVLQDLYDESRQRPDYPAASVIVCGSALSVMSELLSGQKPLRGRAQVDLTVTAFDYRDAADFWDVSDPEIAFHLDAVFGGTPGYKALVEEAPPTTMQEFPAWLSRSVLNPSHALFRETDYLLREDPRVRSKETYQSILLAVANGHHTQVAIGGVVGRDHNQLRYPLEVLVDSGFLVKKVDVLAPSRPLYSLADPIVRFEALVTTPCRSLLEERDALTAWNQSQAVFSSQILGPHFEDMARLWTARYAGSRFGGPVGQVGSAVINDAAGKSQHELDVVGLRRGRHTKDKPPPIVVLGEAKSSNKPRTPADLTRLERIRELLAAKDPDSAGAHLAIFGRSGFHEGLAAIAARRPDVHLVDLADLYR